MSRSAAIRVPSTTVTLILMLGRVLREQLKLRLAESECWTFEHAADYDVFSREHLAELLHDDSGLVDPCADHDLSVYLGSGKCLAYGLEPKPDEAQVLQLRVRCESCIWHVAGLSLWDIQLWTRDPLSRVKRYHFSFDGNGLGPSLTPADPQRMPVDPPRRIAFWKEKHITT